MKALVGKFVIRSDIDGFRTGQVTAVGEHAALVRFDNMLEPDNQGVFPAELVCLMEMIHAEDEGVKLWGFFDTKAELDTYLNWLDAPRAKGTVIKMVPKK